MDQTVTAAGSRLLERFLSHPERDIPEIERRQTCVLDFSSIPQAVSELREVLRKGNDLERILGRLRNRLVRPKELGGLRATIRGLPKVRSLLLDLDEEFSSFEFLGKQWRLSMNWESCLKLPLERNYRLKSSSI